MKGRTLPFTFAGWTPSAVALFHPNLIGDSQASPKIVDGSESQSQKRNGGWKKHHLMFILPPGQADLRPYEDRLSVLAEREHAMLYAINPVTMSPILRKQLDFIDSAILHLRAGCTYLKVLTVSEGMCALITGMSHFRCSRDQVQSLRWR